MHRAIQSTFFEPLIHGLDVMLAKAERVLTREPANPDSNVVTASFHRHLVNIPAVAEQVTLQYEHAAGARLVGLLVDVAPDALVIGDSIELHRLVEQLLRSVLTGTLDGGCVTISGTVAHGVVTLIFSSRNPTRHATVPPRGIDLCAIEVERIVRDHGGRLEVSNSGEQSPRFVVHLAVGQCVYLP